MPDKNSGEFDQEAFMASLPAGVEIPEWGSLIHKLDENSFIQQPLLKDGSPSGDFAEFTRNDMTPEDLDVLKKYKII